MYIYYYIQIVGTENIRIDVFLCSFITIECMNNICRFQCFHIYQVCFQRLKGHVWKYYFILYMQSERLPLLKDHTDQPFWNVYIVFTYIRCSSILPCGHIFNWKHASLLQYFGQNLHLILLIFYLFFNVISAVYQHQHQHHKLG